MGIREGMLTEKMVRESAERSLVIEMEEGNDEEGKGEDS